MTSSISREDLFLAFLIIGVVGLALPPRGRGAAPAGLQRVDSRTSLVLGLGSLAIVLGAVQTQVSGLRFVLALIVASSAADLVRRWGRGRARELVIRRRGLTLAACEAVAADVRAGLPPLVALRAVVPQWPEFSVVARAADIGADVPTALRALALTPGAEQARVMAAAWEVAHRSGARLAPTLELAARALRDRAATATVVATEISAARATASILGVLPFGVLLLGSGVGGDPWGFLIGSAPGLACLAAGLALAHAGLAWLDLIAQGVEG